MEGVGLVTPTVLNMQELLRDGVGRCMETSCVACSCVGSTSHTDRHELNCEIDVDAASMAWDNMWQVLF